ncbi:hypothetical protein FGO68_gene17420 [Halteria grandinella]|uniref:Uncharacterized protein n=1 Tax=Halteria grandinella TaxID=5974 RepID=A0A8J8NUQ6_HALGN|nr:hypothetical protein FGO68_gene17420 [Halteria grandinella]
MSFTCQPNTPRNLSPLRSSHHPNGTVLTRLQFRRHLNAFKSSTPLRVCKVCCQVLEIGKKFTLKMCGRCYNAHWRAIIKSRAGAVTASEFTSSTASLPSATLTQVTSDTSMTTPTSCEAPESAPLVPATDEPSTPMQCESEASLSQPECQYSDANMGQMATIVEEESTSDKHVDPTPSPPILHIHPSWKAQLRQLFTSMDLPFPYQD